VGLAFLSRDTGADCGRIPDRYGRFRCPALAGRPVCAYCFDESGRDEIYVRPFPDGTGKWQALVNDGKQAHWRSDGGELFYVEGTTLMAVSVSTEPTFALGQPKHSLSPPILAQLVVAARLRRLRRRPTLHHDRPSPKRRCTSVPPQSVSS